jgi:hypothetical protein
MQQLNNNIQRERSHSQEVPHDDDDIWINDTVDLLEHSSASDSWDRVSSSDYSSDDS